MALRVLPRLLYGAGHAYGNPLTGSGTTESISKMTREDLVKLHDTWYHPNNATLVIVGDTTLAEIRPKLEKLFANWKPEQVPKKNVSTVSLPQKSAVYLIDKPGAQQSVIIAGIVDRKSTRLNSSHGYISYAVFCLKKKHNKSTRRADVEPFALRAPHHHAYRRAGAAGLLGARPRKAPAAACSAVTSDA